MNVERKKGLWIIDAQTRLFPHIKGFEELVASMQFVIKCSKLFHLPVMVTEQSPEKLGETLPEIKMLIPEKYPAYAKTIFSGYADAKAKKAADALKVAEWILIGIESHICVYQTAKSLLRAGYEVTVLSDATGARRINDHTSALSEMRAERVRVSTSETVFYELIADAKMTQFKEFTEIVKAR